ncbi:MAG: hypothetical protein AAF802_28475 [Planctomycetota bacterium]
MSGTRVFVVLQTLLVIAGLVSSIRMYESKVAAEDALQIGRRSADLASEIRQLREVASVADDRGNQEAMSNVDLVDLAVRSGIAKPQIKNIERIASSKARNSDYEEQIVVVQLNRVSLERLVDFIVGIGTEQPSYVATSLFLVPGVPDEDTANRSATGRETLAQPNPERWNATLTLTQLVFAATRSRTVMRGP